MGTLRMVCLFALLAPSQHAWADENADAWTATTKLSLLADENVPANSVHVDTSSGVLTLHGKVHTEATKSNAENVAHETRCARQVNKLLQLAPASNEQIADIPDDAIQREIDAKIACGSRLKNTQGSVKSVNGGGIYLTGRARNLDQHLAVAELTRRTPEDRSISSNVKVQDEPTESAPASEDQRLAQRVKIALLTNKTVPSTKISVDSRRGEVTLLGQVPTQQARRAAEAAAAGVTGVRSVRNELEVQEENAAVNSRQDDANRRSSDSTSPGSAADAGTRFNGTDAGTGPSSPTTTRTTGGL